MTGNEKIIEIVNKQVARCTDLPVNEKYWVYFLTGIFALELAHYPTSVRKLVVRNLYESLEVDNPVTEN